MWEEFSRFVFREKIRREAMKVILKTIKNKDFLDLFDGYAKILTEPNFVLIEKNKFVEGYIDLLIEKPDEIIILDYKTHLSDSEIDEQIMKQYKNQVDVYERAIRKSYSHKSIRKFLFFVPGEVVKV